MVHGLRSKALAAVVVAAVTGAGVLAGAPAQAASGGGCGTWVANGAYHLKACVSMNGIVVVTNAELLVYGPPAPGCEVDVTAYSAGQWAGNTSYSCSGSNTWYSGNGWLSVGSTAQTVAELKINGHTLLTAYSLIQNT